MTTSCTKRYIPTPKHGSIPEELTQTGNIPGYEVFRDSEINIPRMLPTHTVFIPQHCHNIAVTNCNDDITP